ncbi:hypothetical protein UMK_02775, partial [Enterococcus faecalis ATCC 29200]
MTVAISQKRGTANVFACLLFP